MEINDGSSTQRYCGPYYGDYYNVAYDNLGSSIPGPFTSTGTIRVTFSSDPLYTKSGFVAVVCCSAQVTTDLTSGKLINICLRSRPGDPDVVCPSVSQSVSSNVENSDQMTV